MGVGMVSGRLCRGRRPRRPAEGSRPLPTMQNSNGRRRKVAGRACPAPTGWWMVDRVLAGRGGRHICRPYGVNRQVSYDRERPGRDESLPYGLREREIVGRPALRPPRACAGVGVVAGHPCRGRRPRRPAEGARPLPTMQNSNGRRRKVAGRACPAPTEVEWLAGAGREVRAAYMPPLRSEPAGKL